MARKEQPASGPPAGRTEINVRRKGGLLQHVVRATRPPVTDDPDPIVDKTYKLPSSVVAAVREVATAHNIGIGELAAWLLQVGLDDLAAGRKQLPVETVQIEVPVLGGRRRGRPPALRRIVRGTVREPEPPEGEPR